MELNQREHQELILMLGSRKEWETYLGLTREESNSIWTEHVLMSPVDYVRSRLLPELLDMIVARRTLKKAAEYYGVSETFLLTYLRSCRGYQSEIDPKWTADECRELFAKYKSVRLLARIKNVTEAQIRGAVKAAGLEIAELVDYSTGMHSNAKGRRAELDFVKLRAKQGISVVDRNLLDGSQADYDFDDPLFGKVNVKSSARHRFTAQTRRNDPFYWKFSTKGRDKADVFVVMCYDETMTNLIGWWALETNLTTKASEVLRTKHLDLV